MKHLLITTIAAVVLVGCATTQQPEPTTAKAPDIDIYGAAYTGNIEAIKQHLAAGTDVNAKNEWGGTPLHFATFGSHKEVVELLIAKGADVNAKDDVGDTPVDWTDNKEIADLLRKHGGKTRAELWKAAGN